VVLFLVLNPPQAFVTWHRDWKAKQFLEAAEKAKAAGDWDLAKTKAEQGLRWSPGSTGLRRIIVGAVAQQGKAIDSVLLAEQFFDPATSLEDRANLMEVALNGGDQVTFSRFYNHLSEDQRAAPGIVIQRMRLGLQLGRHEEVEELFANLAESDRNPTARATRLAAMAQGARVTGDWQRVMEGVDEALAGAIEDKDIARQIFRFLGEIPVAELNVAQLTASRRWLLENPDDVTINERLIGVSIEMAEMGKQEGAALLQQTIERFADDYPVETGRWLLKLGLSGETLRLSQLSESQAASDLDKFGVRLDALVAAGQWDEALDWLEQPPPGSHAVMLWLSRAKIADQINDRSLRRQSLTRAIEEASVVSSENRFFSIYEVAVALGEIELASKAAIKGVEVPAAILPPSVYFLPVLQHLWAEGRLEEFRRLNLILLRNQPGDLDRSNDELYLSLLIDDQPKLDQMIEIGQRLIELQPDNVSFRTTLAWILLRSDDPVEARRILDAGGTDWEKAAVADKLVRANVLMASGDEDGGRKLASSIGDPHGLCEEEVEKLLKPLQ